MEKKFNRNDIYEKLTDSFINALNMGIIPWEKPWTSRTAPANLVSKKNYRGSNVWILHAMKSAKGYNSRYWVTFKQANDLGGTVKKGEKSVMVVYWQFLKKKDEKGLEKTIPFLKCSYVFNVEQCQGFEEKIPVETDKELGTVDELENVLESWETKPLVSFSDFGDKACYTPVFDTITMPEKNSFKTTELYYKTLLHEFGHSTGAKSRLSREGVVNFDEFGSHQYAKEELVAEMFASFMLGIAGIESQTHTNSVAYIQNWIKVLESDPKMILQASSEAQKAVDYVMNGGIVKKEIEELVEVETE